MTYLIGFDNMNSPLPLLSAHHIIVSAEQIVKGLDARGTWGRSTFEVPEVEVLLPTQMEARRGQVVLAVVVVQQHLDLLHGHVQSRRLKTIYGSIYGYPFK